MNSSTFSNALDLEALWQDFIEKKRAALVEPSPERSAEAGRAYSILLDALGKDKDQPPEPVQTAQEAARPFDWSKDADAVAVPTQLGIAVYRNIEGNIVIRQEADWNDEEDTVIVVREVFLAPLIDRLIAHDPARDRR